MPTRVVSLFSRLGHVIREFTVAQRTLAIIGSIAVVVAVVALTSWLIRPTYSPLYSGLSGTDASAIVEQLKGAGVPYELADGGASILVPEQDVDQQRLAASAAGLPSAKTDGYSLLDNMGVTTSEFQQSVTYKRALEGELAKTIEALDGVRTASVRLAIPEQTVFVSEKSDPTASVFVDTQAGVTLSAGQVKAITHLVSASVDDMKADDVAVVDAAGTVLSSVGGAPTMGDTAATDYEAKTGQSVQAMLDTVLGAGNATVVVTADVSQESAQRTQETYTTPDGKPAINESSTSETSGGTSGSGATGVLGPDNIAVPSDSSSSAAGSGSSSSSSVKNNAIDKVTETRTIPAGELTKQAVSVAVNSDAVKVSAKSIQAMVVAAAGIDAKRGDVVSVQLVSFAKTGADTAKSALAQQRSAEEQQNTTKIVTTAITAGGILLGLVIILIVLGGLGRRRAQRTAIALGELDATTLAEESAPGPAAITPPMPVGLPAPLLPSGPGFDEPLPIAESPAIDRVRASVEALAGSDPARTAEHLRSLMDDRQPA